MDMYCLIIVVGWTANVAAFGFSSPRDNLNQNATLICRKEEPNLCIMDIRLASADSPDRVYFENTTDTTDYTAEVQDSKGNGDLITGSGTEADPWIITLTVDCGDPLVDSYGNVSNAKASIDGDILTAVIIVKSVYEEPGKGMIFFSDDVRYRPICNFTTVVPLDVISGALQITGTNNETLVPEADTIVLTARTSKDAQTDTTSVILGEPIFYRAAVANLPDSAATGVYLYDCYFCDADNCNGTVSVYFMNSTGCSLYPDYVSRFTYSSTGVATTKPFTSFAFGTMELFLRCSANLCYSKNDLRCKDFCLSNSEYRRKRDADDVRDGAAQIVLSRITLLGADVGRDVLTSDQSRSRGGASDLPLTGENANLLIAVIALSSLLVVGLAVAAGVFIYHSRGKKLLS